MIVVNNGGKRIGKTITEITPRLTYTNSSCSKYIAAIATTVAIVAMIKQNALSREFGRANLFN
ncbi:hypothetical protein ABRG53_1175 [Pseudanabaena sp. ABRG5-3]|nr:hypothetical protein ABRG53_1175 [Pseudanabaena sp. ABRG5-3]